MQKHFLLLIFLMVCFNAILAQAPNGIYEGEVCELSEANIVYYNTPLKIIADKPLKFKDGSIHSSNNENNLHRVSLEVEKVPENTWLILKLGEESYFATCLRNKNQKLFGVKKKSKAGSGSFPIDTTASVGGFVVESAKDAQNISSFLKLEIINRKHFGHVLSASLEPQKKEFKSGDPILLDFSILNKSDIPLQLNQGGGEPKNGISKHFRFKVTHNRKVLKSTLTRKRTDDLLSDHPDRPDIISKSELFKRSTNLSHWFDFKEPGTYHVSWIYNMKLQNKSKLFDEKRAPEFYWKDEVVGSFIFKVN